MRRCVLVCVSACVIAGAGSTAAALCQIPQSFICDGFVVLTVLLVIVSCLLTSFICILDVFYASCELCVLCIYSSGHRCGCFKVLHNKSWAGSTGSPDGHTQARCACVTEKDREMHASRVRACSAASQHANPGR